MTLPILDSFKRPIDVGAELSVSSPVSGAAQASVQNESSAADAILDAETGDESLPVTISGNSLRGHVEAAREILETVSLNAFLRDPSRGSTIPHEALFAVKGLSGEFARILASELNSFSQKALVASYRSSYTVFFLSEDGKSIRIVNIGHDDMFQITELSKTDGDPLTSHLRTVENSSLYHFLRLLRDQCGIEFPCPMGSSLSNGIANVVQEFNK